MTEPQSAAESRPIIVAIDGPAGSGKSSVSREVARRLGYELLDTGAAYRSLAWHAIDRGIDLDASPDAIEAPVVSLLTGFDEAYDIALRPDERWVRVGDTEVSEAIRETEVSRRVSAVARIPEVRRALTAQFRRALQATAAPGIIAEGRDITTVVAPDADARILLTADERVRIARRAAERASDDAAAVAATVSARDAKDRQVAQFHDAAEGVALLDSTELDFEQTVARAIELIRAARPTTT